MTIAPTKKLSIHIKTTCKEMVFGMLLSFIYFFPVKVGYFSFDTADSDTPIYRPTDVEKRKIFFVYLL